MRTIPELVQAVEYPNVQAFTHVLRNGESSQEDSAFNLLYGGSSFDSFDDHPRKHFPLPDGQTTSAAGAYQETESSWNDFTAHTGQLPFTPENQTLCAVWLIDRAGALEDVIAGRLDAAIRKLTKVWTSLAIPKRQAQAPAIFKEYGGSLADAPDPPQAQPENPVLQAVVQPQKVKPVGIFPALLPTIIQLIPQLASVFVPGSDVAKRNVAAATIVTQAISDATQAVNLQDAVEKMQSDPAALAAAQKAIADVWPSLVDSGPAVTEARKSAASMDQNPPWKNPAVWVTVLFIPLIYGAAWAVLYREGASDDLKTMVVTAIFAGLLGSITGFFLGSSLGSQRKDALIGK